MSERGSILWMESAHSWRVNYGGYYVGEFPENQKDLAEAALAECLSIWGQKDEIDQGRFLALKNKYAALRKERRSRENGEAALEKVIVENLKNAVKKPSPLGMIGMPPATVNPAVSPVAAVPAHLAKQIENTQIAAKALNEAQSKLAAAKADYEVAYHDYEFAWQEVDKSISEMKLKGIQ